MSDNMMPELTLNPTEAAQEAVPELTLTPEAPTAPEAGIPVQMHRADDACHTHDGKDCTEDRVEPHAFQPFQYPRIDFGVERHHFLSHRLSPLQLELDIGTTTCPRPLSS